MNSDLPSLTVLSLIIAALAVIFGPLIQLYIAKAQIRVSVLSANRQRWINQLREQIAEFITAASELNAYSKTGLKADPSMLLERTRDMQLCKSRIRLMVNPGEKDHQRLLALLDDASAGINKPIGEDKTDIPLIVSLSQTILKREWERVKETK